MAHRPELQTRSVSRLATGLESTYGSSGSKVLFLRQQEQSLARRLRQIADLPDRPAAGEQVQVQRSAARRAGQSQVSAYADIGQRTLTGRFQPEAAIASPRPYPDTQTYALCARHALGTRRSLSAFCMLRCVAWAMRSRVQASWLTPYFLKPFPRHHNVAITVLRHFSGTNVAIQISRQGPA
jgi:hypothetical protein